MLFRSPAVMIYLDAKNSEQHMAIGYSPYPFLNFIIKPVIQLPPNKVSGVSEMPAALLSFLSKTDINTPEDSDDVLDTLVDTIEEVIRGNATTLAPNRYLNNSQIKVALPVATSFGFIQADNCIYVFAEISLRVEMRLSPP